MTEEEKRLITETPITMDCFEKWEDYHYEEIKIEHFSYPNSHYKNCKVFFYPTTFFESLIRDCEIIRLKYIQTKNEHYFDILLKMLPKSYKVVKL